MPDIPSISRDDTGIRECQGTKQKATLARRSGETPLAIMTDTFGGTTVTTWYVRTGFIFLEETES